MIQYEFKERNNTTKGNNVSLIIVTSPIQSHPNTSIVDEAIQSIIDMDYLFDEMIISYDKPPKKETKDYTKYKQVMKQKYTLSGYKSLAKKITHLPMKKHGHFIGTFYNALQHCKSKYVFLVQHDIRLNEGGIFPIKKCLSYSFDWNIIATHHLADGLKSTHWFPINQVKIKNELWKTHGWSERIFLTKRDWMMDQIRGCYKGFNNHPNSHYKVNNALLTSMRKPNPKVQRTHNFMDTIFHHEFDRLYMKTQGIKKYTEIKKTKRNMKIYDEYWNEWKCYLLHKDVCYHVHLFGRTAKSKKKTKRTKRKKSRGGCRGGGGKKLSQSEFKKLISEKEKEYWDEMKKCNKKCNTIKTNYAKNKKNLKKQKECYQQCEDKRLKDIQSVHKK